MQGSVAKASSMANPSGVNDKNWRTAKCQMSELERQQVASPPAAAAAAETVVVGAAVSKSKQIDHYTSDVTTRWRPSTTVRDAAGIRNRTARCGELG